MLCTIITDASYCHDTGASGYGYHIVSNRGFDSGGDMINKVVPNNSTEAELFALANALHIALQSRLVFPRDEVLLQTDSINAINAIQTSKPRGKGSICGCRAEHIKTFKNIVSKYKLNVRFRHVKGHNNSSFEKRTRAQIFCDRRAYAKMQQQRKLIKLNQLRKENDIPSYTD